MAQRANVRWTPTTIVAALLALAAVIIAGTTAELLDASAEPNTLVFVVILLVLALLGIAGMPGLMTLHKYSAYAYFALGAATFIVALILLVALPSAPPTVAFSIPNWLSVLIAGVLFVAAAIVEHPSRRS